jgi:hypothetical protein
MSVFDGSLSPKVLVLEQIWKLHCDQQGRISTGRHLDERNAHIIDKLEECIAQ